MNRSSKNIRNFTVGKEHTIFSDQ